MDSFVPIRYFDNKESADKACLAVRKEGFKCVVSEDTFQGVPLDHYRVPRRFKILVAPEDFYRIAEKLAKRIRKTK